MREIAETEGTRVASNLNNRVTYLADIGMIAPLLGLLGTVIGIIRSFGALGADVGTARYVRLSQGISEALFNTAAGLAIGIPAMIFYAFFRGRSQRLDFRIGIRCHAHRRACSLCNLQTQRAFAGVARIGFLIASCPMNFRSRVAMQHPGIQLAPLVDVLMLLLIFFLLTWNAARNENELDVKVPKASAAKEKAAPPGDVVVNVRTDGTVVVNRRTMNDTRTGRSVAKSGQVISGPGSGDSR